MESAIRTAIAYLRTVQQDNGSFLGYSSPVLQPFTTERTYHTLFTPALILSALATVPETKDIRDPLATWLLSERGEAWSFNYWAADAPERHTNPYPDDLDDTFCALSALYRHDPALVDAASLGEIVQILLATESQVGGPYRTWLVTPDAPQTWQDIDLAVNANIAFFLRQVADPLPNLVALMDNAIIENAYTSPYYPGVMPVAYFIARAYTGQHVQTLASFIRNQPAHTALDLSLQCSALVRLGVYDGMTARIERLRAMQQADGSWPAAAFCMDPAVNEQPFYQGAPALTTAFALEALHSYARRPAPTKRAQTAARPLSYQKIITAAKQPFADLQEDLRMQCEGLVDLMVKGDHSQEIVMLPQLFASSLTTKPAIPSKALQLLSLANTYGWMAYTVYDNFLDGEGEPVLLSAANTSLRASLDAFAAALPNNPSFQKHIHDTFNTIDGANAWEITHCRQPVHNKTIHITELPRYGKLEKLAERSLGHTLTPVAVLLLSGHDLQSEAVTAIQESLQHYLIARQLQDDMHDWERDIRNGQLNTVVVEILRDLRLQPGEYAFARLVPRMLNAFWQRVLPVMCTRTLRHLSAARKTAEQSGLLQKDNPLYALYKRLEQATHETRNSQAEALSFLQAYKKPLA